MGRHSLQALFRRSQLKAMLDIHGIDYGLGGDLSEDEITVIRGALDLSHKTATSCMTPLDKVHPQAVHTSLKRAFLTPPGGLQKLKCSIIWLGITLKNFCSCHVIDCRNAKAQAVCW